MKEDLVTAIITEKFDESTKKVVGGFCDTTNGGVEVAIAGVYVKYLESTGIFLNMKMMEKKKN